MGYLDIAEQIIKPPVNVALRVLFLFFLQGESLQGGDDSPFSDSVTLEQTTSNIGISSGRVSLWMQWMLPKLTVKLFAPDPENKDAGIAYGFEIACLLCSMLHCIARGNIHEF